MFIEKYSVVIYIKINESSSFKMFIESSLPCYEKYLDTINLDKFYIICSLPEISIINKYIKKSKLPFKLINEANILETDVLSVKNYLKKKLATIAIAKRIKTKYYIVFDSNIILEKYLKYSDMFHGGKLKYSFKDWSELNNIIHKINYDWWKSSCRILDYPKENMYDDKHIMDFSQQILVTNYVSNLHDFLEARYGTKWQKILSDMNLSEYTVYWLYIVINGLKDIYTEESFEIL